MNYAAVSGRLSRKIYPRQNTNGSKTIQGTIAIRVSDELTDFIPFKAFVNKDTAGNGPWDLVSKGDHVVLTGRLNATPYVDKNGEKVYPPADFIVSSIEISEKAEIRNQRRAEQAEAEKQAAATASGEVTPVPSAEVATTAGKATPVPSAKAAKAAVNVIAD